MAMSSSDQIADDRHNYSDQAQADIALVQKAMDDWRIHNDPASNQGFTMAEVIVGRLYAAGRL